MTLMVSNQEIMSTLQTTPGLTEESTNYKTINYSPTTTTLTTAIASAYEISIPLFLEKQYMTDFTCGSLITKGGNGQIYRCTVFDFEMRKRAGDNPVAVKIIGDSLETLSERLRRAFFQELSLMWRFRDHPNFIKVYGYSTAPAALIMKLYQYGDLENFVKGKGQAFDNYDYSKAQMINLMKQYCNGIAYMHSCGFVHCDIKPGNVLLDVGPETRELQVVICDFGITRIINTENLEVQAFQVSEVRGLSMAYAGPEVIFRFRNRTQELDASIWKAGDVYALSMSFLYMVQRRRPWGR